MKKQNTNVQFILLSLLLAFSFTHFLFAQKLTEPVIQEKTYSTLKEMQEDFNRKWEDYNVANGYYFKNGKKHKAPNWKLFKRFEWYWESRVNPETGEFPNTNSAAEYEKVKNTLKKATAYNENWTNLGINSSAGGYSGIGRINCIAFHPSDANTFWVGNPSGGIWKTTDGGSSWTILNNNETVLGVSDIAITNNYATSNTLYIATGDRDGNASALGGGQAADNVSVGVYKSTNGGATWNATGLAFNKSTGTKIMRLLLNPNNNNILLAAVRSNDTSLKGIWKSTDAGANWSRKDANPMGDMEFNTGDPNTIYASSFGFADCYIFTSTDGGENWTFKNIATGGYRNELAVSAANPSVIYVLSALSSGGLNGVYKSTDGGTTFSRVDDGTKAMLGYNEDGSGTNDGQGTYDLSIAANPTNANVVYIGGVNTWKTTDGGSSWSCVTYWTTSSTGIQTVHADKHCHAFQPVTNIFFQGNDGGIYKTTDGGTTWTDLTNGMVISQIYRLGVSQTNSNTVINGLQDNGSKLLKSGSWNDVTGGDGMECIVDYSTTNYMYATYTQGKIYRSTDGGATFPTPYITSNIPGGQPTGAWVTPYLLHPTNPATLFAGFDKVWKTTDRGNTWTSASPVLSSTYKLRSLAIAPSDGNVLYTADLTGMWRTTDGGANWGSLTSLLPSTSASLTYIAVSATDPYKLWVTYGGYTSGKKVYESTDGGVTWTNISTGLPNLPVMCIVHYKNATDRDVLFVGTDLGVYVKDGVSNWASYNTGLPSVLVTELEIFYNSGGGADKLRAATYGRGLWETDIDAALPVELTSFSANVLDGEKVSLKWQTATETNNYGFELERQSINQTGNENGLQNNRWKTIGFVNGHGNSNSPKHYSFVDNNLYNGSKFAYRLKQIDTDGSFEYSDIVEIEVIPQKFVLKQNFPNPFNPSTRINYAIPEPANVKIEIYNITGELIAQLVNSKQNAGNYSVDFNVSTLSNLSTGMYLYRISAVGVSGRNFVQTKKMMLLK